MIEAETRPAAHLFAALRVRNFRLYFAGQAVSLVGTWMQSVAMVWLVLELDGSGTLLGLVVAVQFLPVLLLGAYAGLVVDRVDKRLLLLFTQGSLGLLALALGLLTVTDSITVWMVFAFALLFGCLNAVDNPGRQAFVMEMVGGGLVQNAVSLNSAMVNASRAIGPAIAGGLIATVGVGVCFLINAGSFAAVLAALALMRIADLHPTEPVPRLPGQVREGLRHVRRNVGLLVPLLMMALIGTLAYEFQVILPLFARDSLHGGSATFGFLTAVMGLGAVGGGLFIASRESTGLLPLTIGAALFGAAILVLAVAPSLPWALAALLVTGFASTTFLATGNTTLQLSSGGPYRGRVMALWSVAFLGSTPVGGPIAGAVSEYLGPRWALALGALACLAAAALGAAALRRLPPDRRRISATPPRRPEQPPPGPPEPPTLETELPEL